HGCVAGIHVGFWDYPTFAALFVIGAIFLGILIFLLGLPRRIAISGSGRGLFQGLDRFPGCGAVDSSAQLGPKDVQRETNAMIALSSLLRSRPRRTAGAPHHVDGTSHIKE